MKKNISLILDEGPTDDIHDSLVSQKKNLVLSPIQFI